MGYEVTCVANDYLASGRAFEVRQVGDDDSDKKGHSSPPYWRLNMRLAMPMNKKKM